MRRRRLEIEADRPAAHVGDVHLERLAEGRVRPRRHLPQTRDALGHQEPVEMVRLEELRLVGNAGARADERHLPAQHVDQLRQLVEARLPQEPAERRDRALA